MDLFENFKILLVMKFVLLILKFPINSIRYFFLLVRKPFHLGDSVFLEIPESFQVVKKTFLVKMFSESKKEELLIHFLNKLDRLQHVKNLKNVFLLIPNLQFGLGELENIISHLKKLKENKIKLHGYALTGDLKVLYLLSFLDFRYAYNHSEFYPILPSIETFFFGDAAKKFGVEVESIQSGKYKAFGETFNRSGFSKFAKENLTNLINSLKNIIMTNFKNESGIQADILYRPILKADELVRMGFLHSTLDQNQYIDNYLYKDFNNPENSNEKPLFKKASLATIQYFFTKYHFSFFPKKSGKIVILPLKGSINMGKNSEEEFQSDKISYYSFLEQIKKIQKNKNIKGIIFEIDSPGGSSFASELIHREIQKLGKKMKTIAYFQNVSASGGYYIATACHKIYSNETTITGSIGSVMIRPNLKKLYDRLGIKKDRIGFYPLREVFSEYGPISSNSKKFLEKEVNHTKDLFYKRVIDSRKKSSLEMEKIGGGRVFTGKDFFQIQMVDANITLLSIVENLKNDLDLEKVIVDYIPAKYSVKSLLKDQNPLNQLKSQIFQKEQFNLEYSDWILKQLYEKMN